MQTAELPGFPPLPSDGETDVVVIGAGIAGITTAYRLARGGMKVMVLDDGPIAGGETERTTAHLASALDDRFHEIERVHGSEGARLAAESHRRAIDFIEETVGVEQIDCDFARVDGYLMHTPGTADDELDRELAAARRAGMRVEKLARSPIAGYEREPCLRFADQGQFHPTRYLAGLVKAIVAAGGAIHCDTRVQGVTDGVPCLVKTDAGRTVRCRAVVVATNSPFIDLVQMHTKQHAYRTYAIAVRVPQGSVPRALYWETADPYHYIRLAENDTALIVGGEDHKTGQDDDPSARWLALEEWTRQRFPAQQTIAQWSGQILEPVDGLAYLGRNPGMRHVYILTGDSGHGMTHGTLGALLVHDLLLGVANPWESLYDPKRKSLRSLGEYVRENANVAGRYGDWLHPSTARREEDVVPGSGEIVSRHGKPVAVFRDDDGNLHRRSAVCTHLGGIVHWNSAEASWDCPCHGSRFDAHGIVLNGPASRDLPPIGDEPQPQPAQPRPAAKSRRRRRPAITAPERPAARAQARKKPQRG